MKTMRCWILDVADRRLLESQIYHSAASQFVRQCRGRAPFASIIVFALIGGIFLIGVLVTSCNLAFAQVPAGPAIPTVLSFSPQGSVKPVRQVTARFSTPMVLLGDPRASLLPFDIACDAKGTARWIDSFTWSYDFSQDLPAGLRCRFTLHERLKSLSGESFVAHPSFEFDTGGPSIVETRPWEGDETIDEEQAFILMLDTAPDPATVAENASFSVEGLPERVGVRIIQGADRDILAKRFERAIDKRPFVILQATQRFANDAAIHLIWGRRIKSSTGVANHEDQQLDYKVRKAFAARVDCERENPKAGCVPVAPIKVHFTTEIRPELARRIALVAPDGTRTWPNLGSDSDVRDIEFEPIFKESATYRVELPVNLTDVSGRVLINASRFPYAVSTDEFPPLAKFSARFGIIESADPVLPLTVRNLEADIHGGRLKLGDTAQVGGLIRNLIASIKATFWRVPSPEPKTVLSWLRRVAAAKRANSVFTGVEAGGEHAFTIAKPHGAKTFEVMGLPLGRTGLYVVELKSQHLGSVLLNAPKPMYVPTAALVTNLAVHFKRGKANSLVWVTELETAQPVSGADVAVADCNGNELWRGRTERRGLALVPHLDALDNPPECNESESEHERDYDSDQVTPLRDLNSGVLVTAQRGDDFSFVHSSWQQGIEPWRFNLPTEASESPYIAHTVFDRTLLRTGETVHMKHFIRVKTLNGFGLPSDEVRPDTVSIQFTGGDQRYDFRIKWNDDGTAETDWKIPADAKLGQYQVVLLQHNAANATPTADSQPVSTEVQSGTFEVEEFRVPLMRAAIKLPDIVQVAVTRITADISAEYLSGGAAKGLPVVLRSQITSTFFPSFADFDGFTFVNGPLKEGVRKWEYSEGGMESETSPGVHQRTDLRLDNAGGARTEITGIPRAAVPQIVRAELEFRDPNGETQTVANSVTIWPAKLLAGIRADDWASSRGIVRAQIAVVNDNGQPAAQVPVQVILLSRKFYSYRKRLIGGFYAYDNTEEVKRVGILCQGKTDDRGLYFCSARPGFIGEAVLQVSVADDAGNQSIANTSVYVQGAQRMWFPGADDDRMDVIAEKAEYQPGDIARFQVRMPFAEATALVTVEREGVIAASVMHLTGQNPIVTLPVRDYAPNVFVSVLAVRGRITGIAPTAMIDLGKPAFKIGIGGIRVGWREHRIKVTVAPAHSVYHVREKARVRISVRSPDGGAPTDAASVAVAVVDEGLLELKPNDSWQLLEAMMDQRPYQIETSTAAMQVVGRRHYGLKALPPGGGGGHHVTRELFDTLLLWRAVVPLDRNGDADLEIPLNDSLTSFRIVAIAATGLGDFGTGAATIRSTQELQLFSGLPPFVRAGDSFAAEFSVQNASERPLQINVNGLIEGLSSNLASQQLLLAPGDGKTIAWNILVPASAKMLTYHVDAVAMRGPSDHLLIRQPAIAAVPVRTWQATLVRLAQPITQPIALPADALPGQGGVQVRLAPSLIAGLGGIEAWMRDYPYMCLEQRVSRAVALRDPELWRGIVADLPSYTDTDGLLKYFPNMNQGSDVLTSYFLAIISEAGLTLPKSAQSLIESGLVKFVGGEIAREEPLTVTDLPMRKLSAVEALAHDGTANPSLLGSIRIEPNLWPDSALIDWWSILDRVPSMPERAARLEEVRRIMRARLNVSGTAMHLASDPRNDMWWLMVSPARNLVRLVLLLLDTQEWRDDIPKIMQGALALQQRGAWPSTIANAWGMLALRKFAEAFEAGPLTGTTTATIGSASDKLDWSQRPSGASFNFAWPPTSANLALSHNGVGAPWVEIRADAAIPLKAPFQSGFSISKRLTLLDSNHNGRWRQGDLARVHLEIHAETDMTWVVVDDPIPAGASHLGIGLARESQIATSGENESSQNYLWPDYVERAFSDFRAYYEYVPKGSFAIEYTIRLNQTGTFQLPPTHVEALYEPAMLGELPNIPFTVSP
jgi:uncharacterized protein YfaS (alpha-2-macroglobulin family)